MTAKHYIIVGLVAYVCFLVTSIPAALIIGLLDEKLPQVKIYGVNGTIWNGTAQRISISPSHIIDDVNWSFCTLRLLTAEACVNLDASYANQPLQSQIGIGITGTIYARDLSTEVDAQLVGNLSGLPVGEMSGLISIELETLSWKKEQVPSATGDILWKDAAITVAETASLGDITITLAESDDHPLTGIIKNKGGNASLSGETRISDDGTYNLELKLSPNDTASNNFRASLKMFANPQNDGSFIVKNTGNLKQFGIM